ncbi:uncharacterized protein LOC110839690 isoform X2 [Zootermopsis nevadensis]|uniref:uncharacterized protein LOC110839690 isoform X2 n=1 Tax=Zootermopsis nevadensis TaxID=136037 RepID=UPI000B8EB26D|nr:uncharacterized protein LOC110839690 isoform X2 [Zootermopsis nevadensis]
MDTIKIGIIMVIILLSLQLQMVANLPTYLPEVKHEEFSATEKQNSTTSLQITGSFHSESKLYTVDKVHNVTEKNQIVASDKSETTPNSDDRQWRSIGSQRENVEHNRNKATGRRFCFTDQITFNCTNLDPNCGYITSDHIATHCCEPLVLIVVAKTPRNPDVRTADTNNLQPGGGNSSKKTVNYGQGWKNSVHFHISFGPIRSVQ